MYTRREVSTKTGVGFDAIRYYEDFGLLPSPVRGTNGYRHYDEEAIERLLVIQQAKKCGFALNEIKKLFDMLDHPQNCNFDTDEIIDAKIDEIEKKVQVLFRMKEMLQSVREPLRLKSCDQIRPYLTGKDLERL
ncbi:MAG: MerR family transcriptional regulator [Anaerolinea sp.]|nr:MerR family transcriptional regulator [Anaerolinea sp.]